MRSGSFSLNNDDGAYPFELWDAPTPGNFCCTPSSRSNLSLSNANPMTPVEYPASQSNTLQTDKLLLLQFGDWVEGRVYDEDPPTCIHYWIEWKVTLNNRTVVKDTEQDLVLAPGFYWRLFLQPKLKELLCCKYPHRSIVSDDTSVVVSVTRLQDKLTRRFDQTSIDWPAIEKQLFEWGDHFLAGKRMKLIILFNYIEDSQGSTASRRMTDKRGTSSATQGMLQNLD
ncbi:hypothetical protein GX50_06516 [[Emmonsia] crescens]|uniref:Uncharacterized protein n=1 Tax=[Emmonsia] crescens TaxID=73230 RepID=A0A2B7ZBZ2_9EURO|nr:hypothetical protein GX50_06516 [Emmonsia crescens]